MYAKGLKSTEVNFIKSDEELISMYVKCHLNYTNFHIGIMVSEVYSNIMF